MKCFLVILKLNLGSLALALLSRLLISSHSDITLDPLRLFLQNIDFLDERIAPMAGDITFMTQIDSENALGACLDLFGKDTPSGARD